MINEKAVTSKKEQVVIIWCTLVLFVVPALCGAEESNRTGKGELFGIFQYMGGDVAESGWVDVELEDAALFGFGFGYNFNEYLNLNTDFLFGSTGINGNSGYYYFGEVKENATTVAWDVNMDWNVLDYTATPLVTGGAGFIHYDGGSGSLSFSETDFTYHVGAGVRWDITDRILFKLLYRFTWTKLQDTDSPVVLDGVGFTIGIKFGGGSGLREKSGTRKATASPSYKKIKSDDKRTDDGTEVYRP